MKQKTQHQKPQLFKFTVRLPVGAINYLHFEKERTGVSKERLVLEALRRFAGDDKEF